MRWLLALGTAIWCMPAAAIAADPQTVPPPVPTTAEDEAEIAFLDTATRMTVPVAIAGAGPFRFVVDTGAERTVVSHELARKLQLAPGRDVRLTAMTSTSSVGTVLVPSISVGEPPRLGSDARIEAPALAAIDLGALGILGLDTLQGQKVTIDFDRQVMTISRSSKRRTPRPAADEIVVRARSIYGQLVVTDARYKGQAVRVILDTGSVVSMGNTALQRRLATADRRAGKPIELISVTGETIRAGYTRIGKVSLGDMAFENLPVAFADVKPFEKFGLTNRPAVLLGMDALRLFRRVDIDFANREVRLRMPVGYRMADPRFN
jgi:predicted aspartyl protease